MLETAPTQAFMGTSWPIRGSGVSLWQGLSDDSRKAKCHRPIVVPFSNPQPQTHCVHKQAKKDENGHGGGIDGGGIEGGGIEGGDC